MADLVSGRYGQLSPFQIILGNPGGTVQGNLPVRSNAEYLGLASLADSASALVTNKLACVAVPVDIGASYKTVSFLAGATSPTLTHNYAAVYAGGITAAAQTLLAQSTDATSSAPTASTVNSYTLGSTLTATAANAPYGYWFVGLQQTGTVNSAASVSVAAAVDLISAAVFTNAPTSLGFTVAATTSTAPATLASPTITTIKPIVWLS